MENIHSVRLTSAEISQLWGAYIYINLFSDVLRDEDIPAPMTWDTEVTSNTEAVFSDKLMMHLENDLTTIEIGFYGMSLSFSTRRALASMYQRLSAEIQLYTEDGAEILIKHSCSNPRPKPSTVMNC
ncbi:DUF3231 family protein [Bacillus sp. EB01]|uniref:DUF3231 family protein n=1 Tax=Bacillus sp. EB01 TaxID=1347086 RepID=UPI0005C6E253|nr:DUF3231 family protein [Bacillus sp. EB01]